MVNSKVDAIKEIVFDARRERSSRASYLRCVKALKALGFDKEEANLALIFMGYHSYGTNEPYGNYKPKAEVEKHE